MKKKVLLPLLLASAVSCGGGSIVGIGGSVTGFYGLSLNLQNAEITSPAVEVDFEADPPTLSIPQDTIAGQLSLSYSGSSQVPLRGLVQSAKLCFQFTSERCYNLPISGVLIPNGDPLQFNVQLSDYKTELPWLQVNPYEDRILQTSFQSVPIAPANQGVTILQNSVTFSLPPTTIVAPYVYRVAGRVVEVYQGNTKLCDRNGGNACTVQVNNNVVTVTFSGNVPQDLTLRYSEDVKIDFNPDVDVEQVGRLPNATVPATVEVKVKLESGETLTARANVNFRVVP